MCLRSNILKGALPAAALIGLLACSGEGVSPEGEGTAGTGGGGGSGGGSAGSGGGSTTSSHLYRNQKVDKVDLLFMIDNSASMADKQIILAAAVPDLVQRFTNPVCVDRTTREPVGNVAPGTSCSDTFPGSEREFDPIDDIHIGVITSSLGGHGADSCSIDNPMSYNPHQEDMAHLITRGKDDSGNDLVVDTYQALGFLNWDPNALASPPGESDIQNLVTNFSYMVRGADQDGCGFEASLEAWRRFLVDPAPYEKLVPAPCNENDTSNACRSPDGLDQVILQQRADFLRKDSMLAVIMLTDENDCSVMDGGQNYLAVQALDGTGTFHIARGTEICKTDPWDMNCKSCWQVNPADYPECATGWTDAEKDDALNLRCFEQKRRFGIDFLYPVRRYIDALTQVRLDDGTLNPIFCQDYTDATRTECAEVLRDPSQVFLGGIVGVPWQDIAVDPTNLAQGYRPTEQLDWTPESYASQSMQPPPGLPAGKTLWNMILGEVDTDPGTDIDGNGEITGEERNAQFGSIVPTVDPIDPLMKESVDPRMGTHPATGVDLVQPGTGNAVGHPVNGAERWIPNRNDLQYACVFDLGQLGPLDCTLPENTYGCDCGQSNENPLCWNGSSYGYMQYRAKAYPGRRQLAVLKGVGDQAIVASICPSNTSDYSAVDFGYRPAISAIVDRLKSALQGTCWDQEIPIASNGTVNCTILEASRSEADGTCPPCTGVRSDPTASQSQRLASDPTYLANNMNCACQINQVAAGPHLQACVSESIASGIEGWCYVDPAQDPTHNNDLVASCPADQKRIIRFMGDNVPAAGSLTFIYCFDSSAYN